MTNQLPNKIIRIDQIRINRGMEKVCKCKKRKYMLDTRNRRVMCSSCGAIIDPYDAMYDMALRWEQMNEQLDYMLEQRKQIINYKPWLKAIRYLEKQYRGKKMIPECPRCNEPFYLEELNSWTGREFANTRIRKWKEEHDE
ncbi:MULTISPECIES: hypothetical protein [Virgibacillus]|nr:hypothetical protein [Virgibacillus salexigens]